ncbi:MAG: hypothetical protein Q4A12_07740 [Eubacteriales bacterium]|nr:hypothetical protein [Eubacteriales bacterium]
MAETFDTSRSNCDGCSNKTPEPVCIDAQRIYDSCSDKDCLTDLRVHFTDYNQELIDNAVNVRIKDVDVITVYVDIEPVPFHRGFYSIDMTIFFNVCIDVFMTPGASAQTITGMSVYSKKAILYGSEGSVRTFSSEISCDEFDTQKPATRNVPTASVHIARPIALSAKLKHNCCVCPVPCKIPSCVCDCVGGEPTNVGTNSVFATIGLFSIVQLKRNVQILVDSYEYCIPEKSCVTSSDNPCEMFSRLDFPTNEFFPPNVCDLTGDETPVCGCTSCASIDNRD